MCVRQEHDVGGRVGSLAALDQQATDVTEVAERGLELGVVREIGDLPSGAIVTETALAKIFGKHPCSIRRATDRGELPQPVRLMGKRSWTVGSIVRHMENRLQMAAEEAGILTKHLGT